jgi:hypothetical protein
LKDEGGEVAKEESTLSKRIKSPQVKETSKTVGPFWDDRSSFIDSGPWTGFGHTQLVDMIIIC